MTKEEFEKKMLSGKCTIEEYENNHLSVDLGAFYDFRISIIATLEALEKSHSKMFFGKKQVAKDMKKIKNILTLMSDPNVEYKLFDHDFADDFLALTSYLDDKKYWKSCLDAMKRLYNFTDCRKLTAEDVLNKYPEYEYAALLRQLEPEKYEYWCKCHPNVNIDELTQTHNENKHYTREELENMNPEQIDNIMKYGIPNPSKETTPNEINSSKSIGSSSSKLLIVFLSIGLYASAAMAIWINSTI